MESRPTPLVDGREERRLKVDYSSKLREILDHVERRHFAAATMETGRALESLLRDLYGRLLPLVSADQRERFAAVERRIGGGKPLADLSLGQLLGLYREALVWDALERYLKISLRRFRPESLNVLVETRNDVAHGAAEPGEEATYYLVAQFRYLLSESMGIRSTRGHGWKRATAISVVAASLVLVVTIGLAYRLRDRSADGPVDPISGREAGPRGGEDAALPAALPARSAPGSSVQRKAPLNRPRIAVLYFDNSSASPTLDPLKTGLADMLTTDLVAAAELRVVEREKLNSVLKELKLQQDGGIDPTTAQRVGKLLGAEYLLMGSFFELMSQLRIDCRIVNVETGEIVKSFGITGKPNDFMDLERHLVSRIAGCLAPAPDGSESSQPLQPAVPAPFDTVLTYSRAVQLYDSGNRKAAVTALAAIADFPPSVSLMQRMDSTSGIH
jgi:TolB-like protein